MMLDVVFADDIKAMYHLSDGATITFEAYHQQKAKIMQAEWDQIEPDIKLVADMMSGKYGPVTIPIVLGCGY